MSARTMRARRAVLLRWRVMPAVLISLAAGLGSAVPAPQAAADTTSMVGSPASSAGSARPVIVYVVNLNPNNPYSGTVTPIATATNTAGPPIPVGADPNAIAITPDGKTAYVPTPIGAGTVTPIATATNTAGPPITTGAEPNAIAITPDGSDGTPRVGPRAVRAD